MTEDYKEEAVRDDFIKSINYMIDNDLLLVYDPDTRSLKSVEGVCKNGDGVQLNTKKWEEKDE